MTIDMKKLDKIADKVLSHKKPINGQLLPYQLSLIKHDIKGDVVYQRPTDGYINATDLCKKAGKQWNNYWRNNTTQAYINALSAETRISVSALVQIFKGGNETKLQGVWVHPQVAINLAQWLSPEFAVQVSKWVFEWMHGKTSGHMPLHVKRYMKNREKIPPQYFSMLNEIYLHLIAPLEDSGFLLPDKMVPDASTGRMFSGFLRKEGIDVDSFPSYEHEFLDNKRRKVNARLYPVEYLPKFRDYFHNEWLIKHAKKYFSDRSPAALPHLEHIIAGLLPPPPKKK